jgi:magnesium-transporting ATPase (P-type)
MVKDEKLIVIRGKHNATKNISVWSIVVGDIVLLQTGQRVPADCIIIESSDLVVDETPDDATDDVLLKSKSAYLGRGSDPFLRADTMINRGSCKAVVCCVGEHSSRGKYQADLSDEIN